jgi:hypothetical protein
MGQVSPITMASVAARDAVTGWDAGDMVYCVSEAISTVYDGAAWGTVAAPAAAAIPEVPATPSEQDIVDALVLLGLVTQAEA